jgi:hypothetical protein
MHHKNPLKALMNIFSRKLSKNNSPEYSLKSDIYFKLYRVWRHPVIQNNHLPYRIQLV